MAGYSGVVILFHNLTKDVIIQWTGAEIDGQTKCNIAEALLSALKGVGAEDRDGFHKSYGDIFALVKDGKCEDGIPDVTDQVVVSPRVDNSNEVRDCTSESGDRRVFPADDSQSESSKATQVNGLPATDVKEEPTDLPSRKEQIWWPQMEGNFRADRQSVNPGLSSLPRGGDMNEDNAVTAADSGGFSDQAGMEFVEDSLPHRPVNGGAGSIYLQIAEPCRRDGNSTEGRYICNYCGCSYRHSSSLSRHRLTHKVTCKLCNQLVFEDVLTNHDCRADLTVSTGGATVDAMNKGSYSHLFPG